MARRHRNHRDLDGMVYDPMTATYVERETGRVIPEEGIDKYVREKFMEALNRIGRAVMRLNRPHRP